MSFVGEDLHQNINADVVVIGGGFTGISAALHMAQEGVNVVVLEANTIGFGGSGRNVGLVNAGLWTPPNEVEAKLGSAAGKKLNEALAEGPKLVFDLIEKHNISCSAKRNGTLHCADSPWQVKGLKLRYDQQISRGAPVKFLDETETVLRTGSREFVSSLWDPRAGTIQPLGYVKGLARAAKSAGAKIYENSLVVAMKHDGDVWKVSTSSGTVTAKKVIQATNAYGGDGLHPNQFINVQYFQMATAPLPFELRKTILPNGEGCWNCATVMSSFRLDDDGRMLIGAVGNLESFGGATHRAWALRKMKKVFPQLTGFDFENAWHGSISMTSDHLPKIVNFGPNAISIFGYSGRGISPGTVFGKHAAKWAIDEDESAFPMAIIKSNSEIFKQSKAVYFEAGSTLAHLVDARI